MIPWGLIWKVIDSLPLWAIACLLCTAAGGYAGYQWRDGAADNEQLASVQQAIEQANKVAAEDQELLDESAKIRIKIETRYRTIYRDVPSVATPDCRDLGPDFIRLFNNATRAAVTH
jgi:hypothetical protein